MQYFFGFFMILFGFAASYEQNQNTLLQNKLDLMEKNLIDAKITIGSSKNKCNPTISMSTYNTLSKMSMNELIDQCQTSLYKEHNND